VDGPRGTAGAEGRLAPLEVVLGAAGGALIALAATRVSGLSGNAGAWLLAGLVVAGEAARPWFARAHEEGTAVTTPFLLALLLVVGAPIALVAQALGERPSSSSSGARSCPRGLRSGAAPSLSGSPPASHI